MSLARNIVANEHVFVTPWKALGGSAVCVWPLKSLGRLPEAPHLIRGHTTPISALALSNLQPNLVATGAADAHVSE